MGSRLESEVALLVHELDAMGAARRGRLERVSLDDRLLDWAISHPSFKTQLFRFVDVFPAPRDDEDVVRHLEQYFDQAELPHVLELGLDLAKQAPFGGSISSSLTRRSISRIAHRYIIGADDEETVKSLRKLWEGGTAFTVDVLGEKTVADAESDRYAARVGQLIAVLASASLTWGEQRLLEHDDLGPLPRVNVSVKPTALSPLYAPLSRDEGLDGVRARLRPLLIAARDAGAFVNLDMEHYAVKDLTVELAHELLRDPELVDLHLGIALQAYLKDSYDDLLGLADASSARAVPLTIRLVKGAYWDTEDAHARAEGWPVPVFQTKVETDANFERCTAALHDRHGAVRAAFASHNLRSIAYAVAYARERGIGDDGYEIQMLHGMGEHLHEAIRRSGLRLRVYCPTGELVPGMSYLVRRLLENTANEGFVRLSRQRGADLAAIAAPPDSPGLAAPSPVIRRAPTSPEDPAPYLPEPLAEWHRAVVRRRFATSLAEVGRTLGAYVPASIGSHELRTQTGIASLDPGNPARLVAQSASCGTDAVLAGVRAAQEAWPRWRQTPVATRAGVLFKAAEWLRSRRFELAALEVYEAGKPWAEADADVCEAIDYLEYYGREMHRIEAGGVVQSPPGELNSLRYGPRGIGVVIAPWNFPLAIPAGMTAAALVTGNAVLLKPAEQTPAVASRLVEALHHGGLPDGVLSFLPGAGETIGAELVRRPEIAFIAFTGSKGVGLEIIEQAAIHRDGQRHIKRVVAELGGKNPLIVDSDADLDQAVPIAIASAFGYSGQKCSAASRLIVVGPGADGFVARLTGAARLLRIGAAEEMGTQIGPLIDEDAYERVSAYVARGEEFGTVLLRRDDLPATGYFVGPTIIDHVDRGSPLAREEIFGPVLAVFRADSLEEAIDLANDTEYALTAGIVSRSPANIELATEELRAGNIYVNRTITGAVVGRQPFGGLQLSGVGSKAGGPDYLAQFLEPRTISENTIRQGIPPAGDET